MKGISTVLATILLLMITLALVGMAAGFIFGWWGRASQGIEQVGEGICQEGQGTGGQDKVIIYIRNFGNANQTVEVTQLAPSADNTIDGTTVPFSVEPGQTFTFQDTCTQSGTSRYCVYRFEPKMGGFPITVQVPCL
ncbi:MAG: archaellin/type IV pilin N-terminal domain-containing protein [Candidatus Aenigmatarchaeota archaeon]